MFPNLLGAPFAVDRSWSDGKHAAIFSAADNEVLVADRGGGVLIVAVMSERVAPEKFTGGNIDSAEAAVIEFDELSDALNGFHQR